MVDDIATGVSDELGFLSAICGQPGDDTARLVYADWLQDHGHDQRAEFIRVQVELARLLEAQPDREEKSIGGGPKFSCPECRALPVNVYCRLHELEQREEELLEESDTADGNWIQWLPVSIPLVLQSHPYAAINMRARFARGFVSEVTCTATDWLRHADAVFWHPSQTVECPTCREPRVRDQFGIAMAFDPVAGFYDTCRSCRGTGVAPRPCPATAQPVRAVALTACADWDAFCLDHAFSVLNTTGRIGGGVWSSPKWPGIEFALARG